MTEIPIYINSNTKRLDFHTIVQTSSDGFEDAICEILSEKKLISLENRRFSIFSRCKGDKLYIGVMVYACELNDISKKYFYVDRGCGKTPTQATVIFELDKNERLNISKKLLSIVIGKALDMGWYESTFKKSMDLALELGEITEKKKHKNFFVFKARYDSIEEMIHSFNYQINHRKRHLNLTYTTTEEYEISVDRECYNSVFLVKHQRKNKKPCYDKENRKEQSKKRKEKIK